jgi:hypothetical protein
MKKDEICETFRTLEGNKKCIRNLVRRTLKRRWQVNINMDVRGVQSEGIDTGLNWLGIG